VWDFPSYNQNGPIETRFDEPPADLTQAYTDPDRIHASFGSLYPTFMANIGTINGYESANVPRHARPVTDPAYQGEVYLKDTGGQINFTAWSPNRLTVKVRVEAPGYGVINQNFYPGWQVKSGGVDRAAVNLAGLLAFEVFPADDTVELYYLPPSFIAGATLTGLTILAGLVLLGRQFYGWPGPSPISIGVIWADKL
jgi:hypothetical protein